MTIFKSIYQLVATIPYGKVTTYGIIAKRLKLNPQLVGWALHANKNSQIPCHRVVNQRGQIAKNYSFGGGEEQKKRLEKEGIKFKNHDSLSLKKYLWEFKGKF